MKRGEYASGPVDHTQCADICVRMLHSKRPFRAIDGWIYTYGMAKLYVYMYQSV